jgi:hypothetical protein
MLLWHILEKDTASLLNIKVKPSPMKTQSLYAPDLAHLKAQLAQLDFPASLAIVFASVAHDLPAIQAALQAQGLAVFGASSAGEILEAGGEESVYEESIVALLFDLSPAAFQVKLFEASSLSSAAAGEALGAWAKAAFASPALLVMTSGLDTDGEAVLRGILSQTGPLPLYGGLAGDDLKMQQTFVFDAGGISPKGVLALALDQDKVEVGGVASSGWQAVGSEKTITRSEGNVVYTIDHKPALDVYEEYLGITSNQQSATNTAITAEYPLRIIRQGYSVMRASMLINPQDRSMIYAGAVPQGSKVHFCVAPGTDIIDQALGDMRMLKESQPQADALVLFSCKGRHLALGPMAEDEVKPMQALWGAPLIGFYTYGELGQGLGGQLDFHNNTCVLVTLREKTPA